MEADPQDKNYHHGYKFAHEDLQADMAELCTIDQSLFSNTCGTAKSTYDCFKKNILKFLNSFIATGIELHVYKNEC